MLATLTAGTGGPRVAFLHGLFGQGRNWMQIAKAVSGPDGADARCLLVDLPDHGRSPWSEEFSLEGYAAAVAATLRATGGEDRWIVVGHSLGGKVAMALALTEPQLVDRLVVVDIAPKDYGDLERFAGYIREMQALPLAELTSRADAESRFVESDPGVKAFLLQNLRRDGHSWRWQANLDLFARDVARGTDSLVADWPESLAERPAYEGPVLWIAGAESAYVRQEDGEAMRRMFPRVRQLTVKGAGHWVHTDAPGVVVAALRRVVASAGKAADAR